MGQTKTTRSISATGLFLLIMMTVGLYSCTRTQKDIIPSADYAPYVNAYTGGVISQNSTIRIELTHDQPMVDLNSELKNNPFSFSPSLKGKAYWVSNNTIEFVPEEGTLKPGTLYEGTFQLGDFIEVDKKLKEFNFSFRVQERNFTLQLESLPITATQPDEINIKGEIRFSDVVKKEEVEKMLTASDGKKSYPVEVTATDNLTRYQFNIRQIPREADDYPLTITANGNPAGIDRKQSEEVLIPAKDCFRFMSAERIEQPENGIEIVFSAPLSTTQDLKGLIEIPEVSSSIFQISENRVFIYFEANTQNKLTLNIHEGVKDSQGKALGTSHTISFSEVSLKPQVEMSTTAAILPDSKLLTDETYGKTYAANASVIAKAGSWSKVNTSALKWGVKDRDTFFHALVAVLRPVFGVLDVLLNDAYLGLFDIVRIPGSNGYTSSIVPLMEAFSMYNVKTQYQYREDMKKAYDNVLLDIINPIWDKVEDILNAPLET